MFTEHAGTLTNNTVALPALPDRRGLVVGNPSDTVMTLRFGASAADAAHGIPVPAGDSIALFGEDCPGEAFTLFCAGSGKAYTIYVWD